MKLCEGESRMLIERERGGEQTDRGEKEGKRRERL